MVYRFKIKIAGITKPPVWRMIEVPATFTFAQFNQVIQIAFGWQNAHLWEFSDKKNMLSVGKFRITVPSEYDGEYRIPTWDATLLQIGDIFNERCKLSYIYDFGDYWLHEITLVETLSENRPVAFCVEGKGATPPEDCGGVGGYEELKNSFAYNDDDAPSFREWLGLKKNETWDPAEFSHKELRIINAALLQMREDC